MKALRPGVLIIPFLLLFLNSCEDKSTPPKVSGDYLIDYELLFSYSDKEVQNVLQIAGILYPEVDSLRAFSKYGVDVYKIIYKTSLKGAAINASGLLCVPITDTEVPYLSFQNGTNTCLRNAPSNNPKSQFMSLISAMAGSGYILCIPDYIGFGESDYVLHPYHHKSSNNAAVIDMLLASRELVESYEIGVPGSNDLYFLGYSQGGWATLAAAEEVENKKATPFSLKAVACGAGAYNLMTVSKNILGRKTYPNPFYLPFFVESRRRLNIITQDIDVFFKQPAASAVQGLFDGSYCNAELNAELPTQVDSLVSNLMQNDFESAAELSALRDQLVQNSIEAWPTETNIRLYHSRGDSSVSFQLSEQIYASFKSQGSAGSNVDLLLIDSLDHNDAIIPWGVNALYWINTQAGKIPNN